MQEKAQILTGRRVFVRQTDKFLYVIKTGCGKLSGNVSILFAMSTSEPTFVNVTNRKIIHVDMDAFYASVEQRDHPELRGKPVAVGHADSRGVVATASYEARKFGVHSAMPSSRAKMLCSQLVFIEGRMSHYKEVGMQIREIFHRYTDLVEPISIDEAYLDVTNNKMGIVLGVDVAKRIKADIRNELHLVASAGVSYNKFLAKVASDWRKPDGLCTIHPSRAQHFIEQLPIKAFWGVGPVTEEKFLKMGVKTGADLLKMPLAELVSHFGQAGVTYYKFARGIDDRPVQSERVRKSVGCEVTYEVDIPDRAFVLEEIGVLADDLLKRLNRSRFVGTTLTLKVRFFDFRTVTRSLTADAPLVDKDSIVRAATALLTDVDIPSRGVRLLGLSVSSPVEEQNERQGVLF